MGWFPFGRRGRRRRTPFNNLGSQGLTCGKVTEYLYVGGELGPNDWYALQQEGVTTLINLQQEQQDVFSDDERVEGYLWLPAPDGLAPTLEQLATGVDFIHAAVATERKVFVHCKAGQGRAPLLCACYLISEGASLVDAMNIVNKARPQTMLTPEQGVRLREFAAAFGQQANPHVNPHGSPHVSNNGSSNTLPSKPSSNGTSPKSPHATPAPKRFEQG